MPLKWMFNEIQMAHRDSKKFDGQENVYIYQLNNMFSYSFRYEPKQT